MMLLPSEKIYDLQGTSLQHLRLFMVSELDSQAIATRLQHLKDFRKKPKLSKEYFDGLEVWGPLELALTHQRRLDHLWDRIVDAFWQVDVAIKGNNDRNDKAFRTAIKAVSENLQLAISKADEFIQGLSSDCITAYLHSGRISKVKDIRDTELAPLKKLADELNTALGNV